MEIKGRILTTLQKITGLKDISLDTPENEEFGDYSTNFALKVKSQKPKAKRSMEYAKEIADKLKEVKEMSEIIEKIEVAGPGFINFWLSKEYLVKNLDELLAKGDSYGKIEDGGGKRIMFEFGQPNTHKVPHIGHLFSYIYGSAMYNILQSAGYTIYRANYQGDIGLHVAKCLWAYKKENPEVPESLEDKVNLLQKMYQVGSYAYDEDENAKKEIDSINVAIYSQDPSIESLWRETRRWSTDYYKDFEKRLGVNFDRYYFESEVHEKGKEIVEKNTGSIFKESEGAVIFEGSKYGLHDRVFLTRLKTPTYEAKDMYLQTLKYQEWPFDLAIITTANEQNDYFNVIFKALEELNPALKGKLMHIGFGMMNLKSGKMSSRTGEIIGGIELVDEVVGLIGKIVKGRGDLTESEKEKIKEIVGVGAVKYSFLKNNPLQNVKFDIEESISTEGNSGPYLQYTFARTHSVLAKLKTNNLKLKTLKSSVLGIKFNEEELSLLRSFVRFPEIISMAAKNYSPNILCNYLYDLAQKFNLFYNKHRILEEVNGGQWTGDSEIAKSLNTEHGSLDTSHFRLALTVATGQILKNGLNLLGIQAPEHM